MRRGTGRARSRAPWSCATYGAATTTSSRPPAAKTKPGARFSRFRFELEQLGDRETDLVLAAELRPCAHLRKRVEVVAVCARGQRHVLHFLRQLFTVFVVVVDELLHVGALQRFRIDVDEDRPR